jgi:hypothetical protein
MEEINERQKNQAAFRQLKSFIQNQYPFGRYLAIAGGKIVADAGGFEELNAVLHNLGYDSADVLVVQGGIEYPESVTIFA